MSTLLVTYDLTKPGQNYDGLIKFLKTHPKWCRPQMSTWLVVTSKGTSELRNEIKRYIDSNDKLLVMNVTSDAWASSGLSSESNDWLRLNV